MKASDLKVTRCKLVDAGKLRANVDLQVGELFIIRDLTVADGKNGLFVNTPQRKGSDDKWYHTGFDWIWKDKKITETSEKFKKMLETVVLKAYEAEKAKAPAKKNLEPQVSESVEDEDLPF